MEDPIKIIWKFKNNNKRVQYHQYIFIGNVSKNIVKILEKISDNNLYDSLIKITKDDYTTLAKIYGDYWYVKIFNNYHVNSSISQIKDSSTQKNELIEKYGKDWFKTHIESHELTEKKLIYSYEAYIKDERIRKSVKKGRTVAIIEDDANIDYTTNKKVDVKKLFDTKANNFKRIVDSEVTDSSKSDSSELETSKSDSSELEIDQAGGDGEEEAPEEDDYFEEGMETSELLKDEEVDIEEIERMYQDVDVNPDNDVVKTSTLIKQALDDDKLFEKKISQMIEFDKSKDNNIYDENLKDVYKKFYVTTQYIFKDDTIKIIKDKICCGIKNNSKFGKDPYVVPSRQYLWAEYYFDDKLEKIMLGQKWMRRNELLAVDVEPNNNFRHYEELVGQLKTLRDNMRRYGNKIRREDDENNILYDYENYMMNNEIYMIDLYNEFGSGYKMDSDIIKNLQDVYLKLYFPKIRQEDIKYIVDYLNGDQKGEVNKITNVFETINNDLVVENEIMNVVETVKVADKYKFIFKENYITQSVIHVNLRMSDSVKIDLYRVFNEFTVSEKYPFIQYQTPDGNIVYKFSSQEINDYLKKRENIDVLSKWFENAPYGISFKVKIHDKSGDKFMAMTLNENGRIEYKTQWKEDDMATIDDIKVTYNYVKELVKKLNNENNKVKFEIPFDAEFKYAFINTIQKFELPEKFIINHNDLSEFSRYFYPYIALVIEPRKRQAKIQKVNEKSKFGTYLRFKRVTKYENQARLEQRIMYFMRNYEFTDHMLSSEISKQFNITDDRALEEIEKVRSRYANLKKSRKILKKLENIPKYKPPGIGIDIQGKQRDKYKIRISGARDKEQLDRMIQFMNILIFLYVETYLYKKSERQVLKDKLKKLTKIARRRSKVDDIVNYSKEIKSVKQMTQIDKRRIGFKPDKGQNQWTRSCQNSGDDKKRRPQQYNTSSMEELIKKGYILNKKTGIFEKKIISKGKKKTEMTLKTIKLPEFDEEGNQTSNEIHYACDPEENGEHMYVGFLTRSTNPFGHCMPCCFKKDPMISKNKEKRQFFLSCLGNVGESDVSKSSQKTVGDRLYILQDTNKIQEGRFGFLPKYLDFYFNNMLGKQKKIKHHYLAKTDTGYFFKYGSKQDEFQFLNAISSILDMNIDAIKTKIIDALEKDKHEQLYTYLNNGDIKTQFGIKDNFISYIKYNAYLDFDITNSIISVPGILVDGGLNIVIFQKRTIVIKKTFEKEKMREDFNINCQNIEDVFSLENPHRHTIFMVKENKNYYPIVMVKKDDENSKTMSVVKLFKYDNKTSNIVYHIKDFYEKNCNGSFIDTVVYKNSSLTARETVRALNKTENKDFLPKYQIIDVRNKCKYLITLNNTIIPVRPSGSLYDIQIVKSIDKYIASFGDTFKNLNDIYKRTDKHIPIKPIGVYYDDKHNTSIKITAIITQTKDVIPIKSETINIADIEKMGLTYENKPLTDKIDNEILKGRSQIKPDERIVSVKIDNYENESYELFRLEFSDYINRKENSQLRHKIEQLMTDKKLERFEKVSKLRLILYRLIDKTLFDRYKNSLDGSIKSTADIESDVDVDYSSATDDNQTGGKYDRLIHIATKVPDLTNYQLYNDRNTCSTNKDKDVCNINPHCHWTHTGCYMSLTKKLIIMFVNKMSEELASNDLKAFEIMKIGNYFVSDIVDYSRFTERAEQKIVRSSSNTIKKVLHELFGKDNMPKIGRRRTNKLLDVNYQQINIDNPLIDMKDFYLQKVIEKNLTIYRAYVNGYYWIKNMYNDIESKNLGYYSPLQTDLANYFRGLIIEWLKSTKNKPIIHEKLVKYMNIKRTSKDHVHDFIIKMAKDIPTLTNCIVELYVLSKINSIPIVVYNDDNNVKYIFDDGLLYNSLETPKLPKEMFKYSDPKMRKHYINLRFMLISNNRIPDDIETIYYKDN
jgi:hypothetical protein